MVSSNDGLIVLPLYSPPSLLRVTLDKALPELKRLSPMPLVVVPGYPKEALLHEISIFIDTIFAVVTALEVWEVYHVDQAHIRRYNYFII